ncbi:transcriptional regulator, IclR family [Halarchaeum acidiphilum MH1-52-1]|uniref:Transcriptional regulator, IclR family n=1 Tax=Halarchaeum acidiphilum MH1-52-1 TaxID=1261545 RepID=U2YF12_9EURY|nr:IclR family transcriptional regulator [Halarchaeum acidiphilum]GAD52516.1 transcriptional regulator, IclR family [Halarchaeum acidiphilum MH1-52-1]
MDEPKRIRASERSLTILRTLADLGWASETEIADRIDLAKSTTHYHLKTLADQSFVVETNGQYRISLSLLELGHDAVDLLDVYDVGKQVVDRVARETGELCILMVEERGYAYYVYDGRGADAIAIDTLGKRATLHDGATGKAVLAALPEERVDEIVAEHGLPATTERTITDREALDAELAAIRERGVAFDREERLDGLHCVATAVRHAGDTQPGAVYGAIGVMGPASRFTGDYFEEELPDVVSDAANLIELDLQGY